MTQAYKESSDFKHLSLDQKNAVYLAIDGCRHIGGHCRALVNWNSRDVNVTKKDDEIAHARVINGNRNTIEWWIGDGQKIKGVAEFDFEGNPK